MASVGPPRYWLGPLLGGIGIGLCAARLLAMAGGGGASLFERVITVALIVMTISLTVLLIREQHDRRRASRLANELRERVSSQEQELAEASLNDPLTGLPNRRAFYDALTAEFRRADRYHHAVSCVLIDLDQFKRLNDRYGHVFGDVVLVEFTRMLRRVLRESDLICRYGGDDVACLLIETGAEQAVQAVERVRTQLKRMVFSDGTAAAAVTASYGIATMPAAGIVRPDDLLDRAEAALADAKHRGRDRIIIDVSTRVAMGAGSHSTSSAPAEASD